MRPIGPASLPAAMSVTSVAGMTWIRQIRQSGSKKHAKRLLLSAENVAAATVVFAMTMRRINLCQSVAAVKK